MFIKYSQKHKIELLILFIIVLIGSYLRVAGILTNSFAYTYDVGRDLLAVRDIVVSHKITLLGPTTGLGGLFYGPWWYYILTVPFILSGGNPQGIALFIAITGITTSFLGYVLGKKIGGAFLGITVASLISFSHVFVGISSQIWNPNLAPVFIMILLLLLVNLLTKKPSHSKISSFFVGIFLGLLIDLEIVFGIFFLLGFLLSAVIILKKKILHKTYLFTLLGIACILSPRVFFELRHNFLMSKSIIIYFTNTQSVQVNFLDTLRNRIDIFYNLFINTTGSPKLLGTFLLFGIVILFFLRFKKLPLLQKQFTIQATILIMTFLLGTFLFPGAIWSHYLVGIPVFIVLLMSIGINLLYKTSPGKYFVIILLIILLSFTLHPRELIASIKNPLFEGDAAVYRNQLAVIDYVYQTAKGEKFNYIVYTPPVHDYTYRYLFIWYGQKKYHYSPSTEKVPLYYVILEPDFENPNRLKDWLFLRKDDGMVIREELVKGGIVAQTREH